jgi:hypothetical protein
MWCVDGQPHSCEPWGRNGPPWNGWTAAALPAWTGHSFWVYWAPYFIAGGALPLGVPVYLVRP